MVELLRWIFIHHPEQRFEILQIIYVVYIDVKSSSKMQNNNLLDIGSTDRYPGGMDFLDNSHKNIDGIEVSEVCRKTLFKLQSFTSSFWSI